ncbi:hypothetical protein [Polycladomyces subterraneus]|uniref:Uncharacterized protein n=1 Tax=Polycladomyces subterraneus TaxID=1016997 RepID=A0ABT8ILQ6_9BACL|nr:hypothetical protein [Polycladomyces subterraneus]MDN4593723.1 hypothetical protein [Polycladomyces subterraneus]
MQNTELEVPANCNFDHAKKVIEQCCREEGLQITLTGSLSSYPGSTHWHFKKGRERGTLEVTIWPIKNRIWFSVQKGRTSEWIEEVIQRLKHSIESRLK